MTAAEVTKALRNRRTVRLSYVRSTDTHRIEFMRGNVLLTALATVDAGDAECSDVLAERIATFAAEYYGVDVTRVDVDA